jgi:hypothetical protein
MNDGLVKWHSIISETQFAVHQTVDGIRILAYVTDPEQLFSADSGIELRYELHNGLLSFATGLDQASWMSRSRSSARS